MDLEERMNNNAPDKISHKKRGGTGSVLQDSASMLIERGEKATPVRKQIGKAKENAKAGK